MTTWLSPTSLSGIAVAGLTAMTVGAVLAGWQMRQPRALSVLAIVAVAGIAFQVVHFVEHGAQLAYWFSHPEEKPWLTPWAGDAVTGLNWICGYFADRRPSLGIEALHLLGNTIFFAAVIGVALLVMRRGEPVRCVRCLRTVLWVQGFHVFEHVLLTGTLLVGGEALGFSTGFGELSSDTLTAFRVWFHFLINLMATVLAVVALASMYRNRLLIPDTNGGSLLSPA